MLSVVFGSRCWAKASPPCVPTDASSLLSAVIKVLLFVERRFTCSEIALSNFIDSNSQKTKHVA
ncbi:MAG: hypothetical protein Sw1PiTSA_38710 [Shewanella algae]